jgi:amino acid transporter
MNLLLSPSDDQLFLGWNNNAFFSSLSVSNSSADTDAVFLFSDVQIDPDAPFSGAFTGRDGWGWVSNVIGTGASLGILTSLMVAMLGQARYLCVIGRSGVLPAWLAKVNARTATPINASAFLGESPLLANAFSFTKPQSSMHITPRFVRFFSLEKETSFFVGG